MSTSCINSNVENVCKKYINIIFKYNDDILFCKTINNNDLKLKNIEELEDYLENDKELKERKLYIENARLEENYLVSIIASYSKEYNNGIIDWRYNYSDLSFRRMTKLVYGFPIVITVKVVPEGMGAAGGMGLLPPVISKVFSALKYLYILIKELITIKNRYIFFEENYNINKEFIHKVINKNYDWKRGFIDSNIYDKKDKYEKWIMKDCNYKYNKKEKKWYKA